MRYSLHARSLVCLCLIASGLVFMNGKRLHYQSRESRIILPEEEKVLNLIIQQCHIRCAQCERSATLNELRTSGYWIISCDAAVRSLLFCVKCCRLRDRPGEQKMADLPMHRPAEAPPFTYCGVDMFGPFVIKQWRNEIKRYWTIFTCMASRAVHIDITRSLNNDSFIQALRRVIARRGSIKVLYSDNGANFVGFEKNWRKHTKKWTMRGFDFSCKVLEETWWDGLEFWKDLCRKLCCLLNRNVFNFPTRKRRKSELVQDNLVILSELCVDAPWWSAP